MDDMISRQAAIDDIRTMIPKDVRLDIKWIEMWLKQLPAAQQWIPVTERLPEPGVNVLVDVADIPAGGCFPLIDEICKDGEWLNCDGSEWLALAWMPIPDPLEGGDDG